MGPWSKNKFHSQLDGPVCRPGCALQDPCTAFEIPHRDVDSKRKDAGNETTRQPVRWCTVIRSGQLQFILIPMEDKPEGLTDKLYWCKSRDEWHCFRKLPQVRGYVSLCQRREIALVQGQQIARPEARLRCGLCDGVEMARRGWEGSGPASPRRAGTLSRRC
jgi:hypothetical protein